MEQKELNRKECAENNCRKLKEWDTIEILNGKDWIIQLKGALCYSCTKDFENHLSQNKPHGSQYVFLLNRIKEHLKTTK